MAEITWHFHSNGQPFIEFQTRCLPIKIFRKLEEHCVYVVAANAH
jgi:hypothetical protein